MTVVGICCGQYVCSQTLLNSVSTALSSVRNVAACYNINPISYNHVCAGHSTLLLSMYSYVVEAGQLVYITVYHIVLIFRELNLRKS